MVNLIAWFVLAYGFSNIMVYGSIFSGFRNFFVKWGSNEFWALRPCACTKTIQTK